AYTRGVRRLHTRRESLEVAIEGCRCVVGEILSINRSNRSGDLSFGLRTVSNDHQFIQHVLCCDQLQVDDRLIVNLSLCRSISDVRKAQGSVCWCRDGIASIPTCLCCDCCPNHSNRHTAHWRTVRGGSDRSCYFAILPISTANKQYAKQKHAEYFLFHNSFCLVN